MKYRNPIYDLVRAICVVCMIISHGLYFFTNTNTWAFNIFSLVSNTIIFSVFLFVSGMVSFNAYLYDQAKNIKRSIFTRALILYLGYLFISLVSVLTEKNTSNIEKFTKFFESSIFFNLVSFAEFLVPFIFLPILLFIFRNFILKIIERFYKVIIIGLVSYLIAVLFYFVEVPSLVIPIKGIITGSNGLLNFPILSYLPIYIVGIYFGFVGQSKSNNSFSKTIFIGILFTGLLAFAISIIYILFPIPIINPLTRWPPSLGFLMIGLFASFFIIFITQEFYYLLGKKITKFLVYIGRDSYDLYISHMILLFLWQRFVNYKFENPLLVFIMLLGLFSISIFISSLNWKFSGSIFNLKNIEFSANFRYRIKKRYTLLLIFLLFITFIPFGQKSNSAYGGTMVAKDAFKSDEAKVEVLRKWYLKMPGNKQIFLQFRITDIKDNLDNDFYYEIKGTDIKGKLLRNNSEENIYQTDITNLPVGIYTVIINPKNALSLLPLYDAKIYISEPYYVSITFDWEGFEVDNSTYESINNLGSKYNLNFTHYFNPRIYINGVISSSAREKMNEYILFRKKLGDEIAMHLHMYFDLVKNAGVNPRENPKWGYLSDTGYDVYTSAYSKDEMDKIIKWSLNEFQKNGLGVPLGYRAGGWYANSDLLKSLEENGFLYDSSSRPRPESGAFRNIMWDIAKTQMPYYPDFENINTPNEIKSGILEIPNNGNDTYEYSESELIDNFYTGYNKDVLKLPQAISFVTHPQWASREFSKLERLLGEIGKYSYLRDTGPVVFVRAIDLYEIWK